MTQAISQSDEKTLQKLKESCCFSYEITDGFCTSISFHDESKFGSTLRRHPFKHEIVRSVAQLPRLQKLNLRKSKLGHIPEVVSEELEYLDISCNDIKDVPSWVLAKPLKFLSLGANQIKDVPDLSDLPLEVLKLHKNVAISKLPKMGKGLKSLNLFLLPQISSIPENIQELESLETFSFGVTQASHLPDMPKGLRWLTLTVNQLEEIPDSICSLKQLEGLWLAKNKLRSLPDRFGELQNLRVLTLYSNQLKRLPSSFWELKLNKLNLQRNPLENKDKIRFDIEFFRI